jgi:hypothetical protein
MGVDAADQRSLAPLGHPSLLTGVPGGDDQANVLGAVPVETIKAIVQGQTPSKISGRPFLFSFSSKTNIDPNVQTESNFRWTNQLPSNVQ